MNYSIMVGMHTKPWLKPYFVILLALGAVVVSMPSPGWASQIYRDLAPFCLKNQTVRHYATAMQGLPNAQPAPRHLPFVQGGGVVNVVEPLSYLIPAGNPIRYKIQSTHTHDRLDWTIESRLIRVDPNGTPLRLVRSHVDHIYMSAAMSESNVGFKRSPKPGLYRYDLTFRNTSGILARYKDYYLIVRRNTDIRIHLNKTSFQAGDYFYLRLKNFGTQPISYLLSFAIQRRSENGWLPVRQEDLFGLQFNVTWKPIKVNPGEVGPCSENFAIPEKMTAGRYRIVKAVELMESLRSAKGWRYVVAEFSVF